MLMKNIYSPEFDDLRNWIRKARQNGLSWEQVRLLDEPNEEMFRKNFKVIMRHYFADISIEEWHEIVDAMKEAEIKEQSIMDESAMVTDDAEDNPATIPTDPKSSWVLYKEHLKELNWSEESIQEIERSTIKILRRLNREKGSEIIKGMVVGHVQSGKTANMAALMAMAADWNFNMFIVLSGTIENLRRQTQDRIFKDLDKPGNLVWRQLDRPSLWSPADEQLQNLYVGLRDNRRYFTVCLKNSKRLEDLIRWLQSDPNKYQQLRIIVIDDEADQGGINTADISASERSKINRLIVNLVEGKRPDGTPFHVRPYCMNYIGYTATPYANFLNESSEESLYPRNFIRTLKPPKEYIGAKQIFGIEGTEDNEGMNIVRDVPKEDLQIIKELHQDQSVGLPKSLKEALLWFLCATAAMRKNGYRKKAISMLVHTSQKQDHHLNVALAIRKWLENLNRNKLLKECKDIWERETKLFTKQDFEEKMPGYSENNPVSDYPEFNSIKDEIVNLVSEVSHIPLNEGGELIYHKGIHLCIDNCANYSSFDEEVYVRLAYPDPSSHYYPDPAPAFIVVGGSTLSRGLTIEGLVSTYFLRAANQADSLMQMGRWFGYRRGYELYPRIWMTDETKSKFVFLASLEQELRDDLRRYMDAGEDPSVFGPRVRNSPKVTWLRITARNRMQSAVETNIDFSGTNVQTVVFSDEAEFLEHNIKTAEQFLFSLGDGVPSYSGESLVWRDVPFIKVRDGLLKIMKFHPNASTFNQIEAFCDWYEQAAEEAGFTDWNIIAAGTKAYDDKDGWKLPGGMIGKIKRSRKKRERKDNSLNIGVLRAPKDLFEDIDPAVINNIDVDPRTLSQTAAKEQVIRIREQAGLSKTPQLILYRIDKNSEAQGKNREKLNVPHDIIGINIWIPNVANKSLERYLTVKISKEHIDLDDETGDSNEN